jgi:hypothetical protein
MINTHQLLVSRVFSKNFLRDVQADAFEILEATGLYADEGEKAVVDELMPWLYSQVTNELKKEHHVSHFLDSMTIFTRNCALGDRPQQDSTFRDRSC